MLSKSSHKWESFPRRRALKHLQSRIASHHKYLEIPSEIQPLEQELCSMTMGCQPPKGPNHSNCDPWLENQIKINNKSALDCKRLIIQASSCKSFNVQHLIYPFTLSWHLLRVGKTLWQCKCLLAFNRFSVLVCKRYLGKEWMTTLPPK